MRGASSDQLTRIGVLSPALTCLVTGWALPAFGTFSSQPAIPVAVNRGSSLDDADLEAILAYMMWLCYLVGCGAQSSAIQDMESKMREIVTAYEANGIIGIAADDVDLWRARIAVSRRQVDGTAGIEADLKAAYLNTLDDMEANLERFAPETHASME